MAEIDRTQFDAVVSKYELDRRLKGIAANQMAVERFERLIKHDVMPIAIHPDESTRIFDIRVNYVEKIDQFLYYALIDYWQRVNVLTTPNAELPEEISTNPNAREAVNIDQEAFSRASRIIPTVGIPQDEQADAENRLKELIKQGITAEVLIQRNSSLRPSDDAANYQGARDRLLYKPLKTYWKVVDQKIDNAPDTMRLI